MLDQLNVPCYVHVNRYVTICIVLKMTYFMHLNSSDQQLSPGKIFSNLVII